MKQSKLVKQIKRIIANNKGSHRSLDYQQSVALYVLNLYERSIEVDDLAVNHVLRACIQLNASERALSHGSFWRDAEKRAAAKGNRIEYALLLKACMQAEDPKRGKELIARLNLCGIEHRAVKTALIGFFGHFGDLLAATTCFQSGLLSSLSSSVVSKLYFTYMTSNFLQSS